MALPALKWLASPNFSARTSPIDLVVLHDCEGSYAGAVEWFGEPKSAVSAHIVLKEDGTEATQMVDFRQKAWHADAFNSRSIGIEMGGFAARGFPAAEWQTAADVVAYLLHAFGIPCQWAQRGVGPGFTSHFDLGMAGGGHHDPCPTTDPKWAAFIDLVQASYRAGGFPIGWGHGAPLVERQPPQQPKPQILGPDPTQPAPPMSIADAQRALNARGASLDVDGRLGPATRSALRAFQAWSGLIGSGELTPDTVAALQRPITPAT